MDELFRDWEGLPAHVLDMVVAKLDLIFDYVRFRGVCPQWRSVALEAKVDHKVNLDVLKASRKKLPMLIFKTDETNDERMSLYSVTDKVTYTVKLPLPYKYRFAGSSLGWLFCLEETMVVTLVNPYNNGCISLPVFKDPNELFNGEWPSREFDYYITKGIFLSDSYVNPDSFVVVVIYGVDGELAFFRSGEPFWNFISPEIKPEIEFLATDIIYYKGKIYGADLLGQFVEIDLDSKTIKRIVPQGNLLVDRVYLVESQDGELLMVQRSWFPDDLAQNIVAGQFLNEDFNVACGFADDVAQNIEADHVVPGQFVNESLEPTLTMDGYPKTFEFKVLKMTHPIEEGSATWVRVNNIGEQALFVGDNHSVSVSTIEFPWCLPNSIYYVSDHHNTKFSYSCYGKDDEDSGIFNIEDRSFSSHHVLESSSRYMHPPIWFVPKP